MAKSAATNGNGFAELLFVFHGEETLRICRLI